MLVLGQRVSGPRWLFCYFSEVMVMAFGILWFLAVLWLLGAVRVKF